MQNTVSSIGILLLLIRHLFILAIIEDSLLSLFSSIKKWGDSKHLLFPSKDVRQTTNLQTSTIEVESTQK